MTPKEAWSGRRPAVNHFKIFGCIAYAHILYEKRSKLDNKGQKYIFLGVSNHSKAHKLYNPITKKIVISRDVIFYEESTWSWSSSTVGQKNLIDFDGENEGERQQSLQQTPAVCVLENPSNGTSATDETSPTEARFDTAAGSHPQRVRMRPIWIEDYEVTGIDMSENSLTHYALFF